MPLIKKSPTAVAEEPKMDIVTPELLAQVVASKERSVKNAPMTKDDYWRRREERDAQRDKDMAWSGLAQAALDSVGIVQLNTTNTLEGFVELVVKATDLLLKARDSR